MEKISSKKAKKKQSNKEKEKLYESFSNNIIDCINKAVKNKLTEKDENGKKYTKSKIAEELGIDYQSLLNYTTNRVPEAKQLIYIAKYFNIPTSLIFKDLEDDNNSNKENITINNSALLGLDQEAQAILIKLSENSIYDSDKSNYENKIILFLINSIIKDNHTLKALSDYFSLVLLKQNNDKIDFKGFKPIDKKDSIYLLKKYETMIDVDEFINYLAKRSKIPKDIKDNAIKNAYNYYNNMQEIIKKYSDKNYNLN